MFDDIGTAQRQGCAVFSNSFISDPRPGDPHSDQAVQRLRFWTAVHEIGHTFNLAHSWQKNLGPTSPGTRLTTMHTTAGLLTVAWLLVDALVRSALTTGTTSSSPVFVTEMPRRVKASSIVRLVFGRSAGRSGRALTVGVRITWPFVAHASNG
jgi:hypothetical protein